MIQRSFHIRLNGLRGIPAILAVVVLAILAIALVAMVLLAGLVVVAAGLVLSICAAVYYAVRRKLAGGSLKPDLRFDTRHHFRSSNVRVIDVEALPEKKQRRKPSSGREARTSPE